MVGAMEKITASKVDSEYSGELKLKLGWSRQDSEHRPKEQERESLGHSPPEGTADVNTLRLEWAG